MFILPFHKDKMNISLISDVVVYYMANNVKSFSVP